MSRINDEKNLDRLIDELWREYRKSWTEIPASDRVMPWFETTSATLRNLLEIKVQLIKRPGLPLSLTEDEEPPF